MSSSMASLLRYSSSSLVCLDTKSLSLMISDFKGSMFQHISDSSLICTSQECLSSSTFSSSLYLSLYSERLSMSLSISAPWKRTTNSRWSPMQILLSPGSLAMRDFLISQGSPGSIMFQRISLFWVVDISYLSINNGLQHPLLNLPTCHLTSQPIRTQTHPTRYFLDLTRLLTLTYCLSLLLNCLLGLHNRLTTQIMTQALSHLFFGNKLLLQQHYQQLNRSIETDLLRGLFGKWLDTVSKGNPDLQQIQLDFLVLNVQVAVKMRLSFQKFSSFVQLSVAVFQDSFKNHLDRKESFQLFKNIIVRHSLFRPPISVKIFQNEEVKALTKFWVETFDRHYERYECCFGTILDQRIVTFIEPTANVQNKLVKQKLIGVESIRQLLQKIQVS